MKVVLSIFVLMLFSVDSFAERKIYDSEGNLIEVSEERAGEIEAEILANEPGSKIADRLKDQEAAARATANPGGSVTKNAKNCKSVKIPEGLLNLCQYALRDGKKSSVFYELDGVPYEGLVIIENGRATLIPKDQITKFSAEEAKGTSISLEETPDIIYCGNPQRRTKYTSLVCNCFHESRGQSFEEQVAANRSVHSRVMSAAHPSNVVDVVYARNAYEWTRIPTKKDSSLMVRDVVLDENSKAFKEHFPGESNSLRSCKRSSLESIKFEDEFFAVAYAVKGSGAKYHKDCAAYALDNPAALAANKKINSNPNLAHDFFSACEYRDARCLKEGACVAPRKSLRPTGRPSGAVTEVLM